MSKNSQEQTYTEHISLIASYMQDEFFLAADRTPDWDKIAGAMSWSPERMAEFRDANLPMLEWAIAMEIEEKAPNSDPPSGSEIAIGGPDIPAEPPSQEEVSQAIAHAESNLGGALQALGFDQAQIEDAKALQRFNAGYFKESMDMVSASSMRTIMWVQEEQKTVRVRLAEVRLLLSAPEPSSNREALLDEEKQLARHFIELGQLGDQIQGTWYRGAGTLATMQAKLRTNQRGRRPITQRSNKPGFRPTIEVNGDVGGS